MHYSVILDGFNKNKNKKKKKVTSTITLSLSRLVFKFIGLVGNTLYGCLEGKKIKNKCTGCRGCIQHTHKDTPVSNSTILKHWFILNHSLLFLDTVP